MMKNYTKLVNNKIYVFGTNINFINKYMNHYRY